LAASSHSSGPALRFSLAGPGSGILLSTMVRLRTDEATKGSPTVLVRGLGYNLRSGRIEYKDRFLEIVNARGRIWKVTKQHKLLANVFPRRNLKLGPDRLSRVACLAALVSRSSLAATYPAGFHLEREGIPSPTEDQPHLHYIITGLCYLEFLNIALSAASHSQTFTSVAPQTECRSHPPLITVHHDADFRWQVNRGCTSDSCNCNAEERINSLQEGSEASCSAAQIARETVTAGFNSNRVRECAGLGVDGWGRKSRLVPVQAWQGVQRVSASS
jgi:hypothetical protein